MAEYVAVVLAGTEDVWIKVFTGSNMIYCRPGLVLFGGDISAVILTRVIHSWEIFNQFHL
jgi:predicted metalloprotease